MELHAWLIYLAAAVGLSLSPGPNGLLALTHGALHGRMKAVFTIAGGAVGFTLVIALSTFGIGALLQASLLWFTIMKIAGGAYLVWLGVQVWRAPPITAELSAARATVRRRDLFRQGFLSAATNPKGILFFAAFLPQFIDPERSLWTQFLVMAGTFVVVEIITEMFIAAAASRIRHWLMRTGRRFNQVCGGVFVAIGAALALRH